MSTASIPNPWVGVHQKSPWQEFFEKMSAWPRVLDVMKRTRVGTTPSQIVYREDGLKLLKYESDVEKRFQTPVLVVFALVNRPYILDLRPGKSVVAHFLQRGFETYNVDWGVPTPADKHLTIEDYVLRYLDHCVDQVRAQSGVKQINILGYCMGGTLTAMYAALRPEKVKNLMLLAAPTDWSTQDSLLQVWTDPKYFDIDKVIDTFGNAPPQWLQGSFLMLKPVSNLIEKYVNFYENMEDEKYLEDYFAMETWLNDNIPVAGETFRRFVKDLFQRNQLIEGKFELAGRRVDLKQINCPLLSLIAQHDHLVPPSQSMALHQVVSATDRKIINLPAGHIGLAVGSRAHRELWPKVCDWLEERSLPASP